MASDAPCFGTAKSSLGMQRKHITLNVLCSAFVYGKRKLYLYLLSFRNTQMALTVQNTFLWETVLARESYFNMCSVYVFRYPNDNNDNGWVCQSHTCGFPWDSSWYMYTCCYYTWEQLYWQILFEIWACVCNPVHSLFCVRFDYSFTPWRPFY